MGNDIDGRISVIHDVEDSLAEKGVASDDEHALSGLALSGGGIRSATFSLGVLQSLISRGLLKRIDYLSSVSGGGYTASCLSALISRDVNINSLVSGEATDINGCRFNVLAHLRRYSNYLTPRLGLMSLDSLTAFAIISRNIILNQLVLALTLAAILLLPHIAISFFGWTESLDTEYYFFPLVALLAFSGALWLMNGNRNPDQPRELSPNNLHLIASLLILTTCVFLAQSLPPSTANKSIIFGLLTHDSAVLVISFVIFAAPCTLLPNKSWQRFLSATISGTAGISLIAIIRQIPFSNQKYLFYATWPGSSVIAVLLFLTITLHIGLIRRSLDEADREWFGRLSGQVIGLNIAWSALCAISLIGPSVISAGGHWLVYGGGAAWLAATLTGLIKGYSENTKANPISELQPSTISSRLSTWSIDSAPYVFGIGILFMMSWAISELLKLALIKTPPDCKTTGFWLELLCEVKDTINQTSTVTARNDLEFFISCVMIFSLIVIGLSYRIDINLFSLHQFYRNRLTRAYLGASRIREPNPYTDFDMKDDLPLSALENRRPFLIINSTLNITDSSHLEWQQRKAASFFFTPKHCGFVLSSNDGNFALPKLRKTADYLKDQGNGENKPVHLGTAMAISGAAANPNQGYNSSPALAFLMALFNIRLGRWCGNPARDDTFAVSSPEFGLGYLLRELLGRANEKTPFVNLSDGGHFENLGIYELVRRRCRLIIACDAEEDREYRFEGLGNAIRKCRIDFGVEISFEPTELLKLATDSGANRPRFIVGRINYPDVDGRPSAPGVIIYIKPVVRGDEAADVLHYARTHPAFPHQSTADQWFDEPQFESYRELGFLSGEEAFRRIDSICGTQCISQEAGQDQWVSGVAIAFTQSLKAGNQPKG